MARRVFFSFHYENDCVRAGQVRNSNVVRSSTIETSEFIDAVKWESVRRNGEDAIKRWIQSQLNGTSVTVVLVGAETSERKWVQYEIDESRKRGNGLLAVHIHRCPLFDGSTDVKGKSPFEKLCLNRGGRNVLLSELYKTYDWIDHNGRENMGNWIEAAVSQTARV